MLVSYCIKSLVEYGMATSHTLESYIIKQVPFCNDDILF